ncbi:NAD(P)-dependent oxidoreductase [Nocardia sp. NPDC050406]|uniref:NAD(P)-dependent oxidoreductase n=1 Tax=Nocardia sp. NPDC050406 TaxID=3364318 RepID=UPI0037966BFD
MKTAVTVIGLGQMGTRLAQAFLTAGHPTTVWNRSPARADALVAAGAARAATVQAAVKASPLIVICVPDYDTVREVVQPLGEHLSGRTLVNLTSGTPQDAERMADVVNALGADYLDGAAMSGTRLVGQPDALFLFSGARSSYTAHTNVLVALGNSVYLGPEPGLTSTYDTALFGLAWGSLVAFYHAVALVEASGVDPTAFATVAAGHMPFITSLMPDHARHITAGSYPDDDGTVTVHTAAIDHLIDTSHTRGIRADLPELVKTLLLQAERAGHGGDGIASVIETLRKSSE